MGSLFSSPAPAEAEPEATPAPPATQADESPASPASPASSTVPLLPADSPQEGGAEKTAFKGRQYIVRKDGRARYILVKGTKVSLARVHAWQKKHPQL